MEISLNQRSNMVSPIRKILRWTLTFIGGVTALAISIIVVGILINLKDEPLDSKAKAMLDGTTNAVDPKTNGYFVLIAMDADESLDVLKTGQEVTEKYITLSKADPLRPDYTKSTSYKTTTLFTRQNDRCRDVTSTCIEADILNRNKVETMISQSLLLLKRYEMIQQLPNFEEPPIFSVTTPLPQYLALLNASDVVITKAVFNIADGKTQEGIDALKKNDQFLRRLMQQSSTLTSKHVVSAILRKQIRAISEIIEVYPRVLKSNGNEMSGMLRPMSEAELSMASSFKKEAQFVLKNLTTGYVTGAPETVSEKFSALLIKAFYQPNITMNLMANYLEPIIQAAHLPPSGFKQAENEIKLRTKDTNKQTFSTFVHFLYNPVGKGLYEAQIAHPESYFRYMEQIADLDGYIRLVGLQAEIRRKGVTVDAIQNFVATTDSQFRSPYDATPMTWVAQKKQLQFVGRQNYSDYKSDLSGRNIYTVQLH
ncbi:hypothetical protein H8K32_05715 [Undibacterium jejuense]|uniref:Uncharacterized protein n=1 Tax=Undibacterium jejuense TaxID=1344949 RepID=A0A923HBT8_9BURK|nr:hypothetical protein [Undibacterium jejuense]MBC3861592.1 hypothetical protein [Undibacterium jejuense]